MRETFKRGVAIFTERALATVISYNSCCCGWTRLKAAAAAASVLGPGPTTPAVCLCCH